MSGSSPSGRSSFWVPMRVEAPAARITALTIANCHQCIDTPGML
jgi:hypothetical protein